MNTDRFDERMRASAVLPSPMSYLASLTPSLENEPAQMAEPAQYATRPNVVQPPLSNLEGQRYGPNDLARFGPGQQSQPSPMPKLGPVPNFIGNAINQSIANDASKAMLGRDLVPPQGLTPPVPNSTEDWMTWVTSLGISPFPVFNPAYLAPPIRAKVAEWALKQGLGPVATQAVKGFIPFASGVGASSATKKVIQQYNHGANPK